MNFDAIIEAMPMYATGIGTTLQLLAVSLVAGLLLAMPLGIARASNNVWISRPVWIYKRNVEIDAEEEAKFLSSTVLEKVYYDSKSVFKPSLWADY